MNRSRERRRSGKQCSCRLAGALYTPKLSAIRSSSGSSITSWLDEPGDAVSHCNGPGFA